ncbi:MAG: glycosyltransferase [Actinobacteria bacterium]|nr:glycosyltransferase [Actinomycetota bacterium]
MSRVVVAGPYPTMPGPEAAATLALVRELVAAGDDVTVVSPAPSAAHHHLDVGGARGALRLARLAADAERLLVRLDAESLAASCDPPRALPGRLGLALAVRRAPLVELRLDRVPPTVSRRWTSLVLAPAARVVVATADERTALLAAGVDPAKVSVEEPPPAPAPPRRSHRPDRASSGGDAPGPAPASAADLEELVRRRAIEERMLAPAAGGPAAGRASLPLRHLSRMERAPVKSDKPAGMLVKRALGKLMAWQFDWVIQHVNQLHQATIDALDEMERRHTSDDTTS